MTKRKGISLPDLRSGSRVDQERKAFLSAMVTTMASDARVLEATPSLRALYAFLGTKPGERPRP